MFVTGVNHEWLEQFTSLHYNKMLEEVPRQKTTMKKILTGVTSHLIHMEVKNLAIMRRTMTSFLITLRDVSGEM